MTNRELISQVKTKVRAVNADAKLTNKFIYSLINKHARWLIKRESDKLNLMGISSIFQTLKCVKIEEAPAIDECCGIRNKCTVMRTKFKLPKMFEDGSGVIIKSIYTIDGSEDFTYIKINDYIRKLEDPNSVYDKTKYVFYNNGYLYFPKSKIRMVMVKAFFEEDVQKFNSCENKDLPKCVSRLDEESFLPEYIMGELLDFVFKDLIDMKKIQPDEDINKNQNRIN